MLRRLVLFAGFLLIVLLVAVAGHLTGLATYLQLRGYVAPVWQPDGKAIYYFERRSAGFVFGVGWEGFSPPASVFLVEDRVALIRLDPASGAEERLHEFEIEPHLRRWVDRYHNSIFGWLSAAIDPEGSPLRFWVGMDIYTQPSSEHWGYAGQLQSGRVETDGWQQRSNPTVSPSELVLLDGRELLTALDEENYGQAIVELDAEGTLKLIRSRPGFVLDPHTRRRLEERSRRSDIERVRRFRAVSQELTERYRDAGASEGEALLQAYDEMENRGLLPRTPRLSATRLPAAPAGEEVYVIPELYFQAGLFKDIAQATAAPGTEVKASTGDHYNYGEDDTGVRLRDYRDAGNTTFVVQTRGGYFRLSVKDQAQ